MATVLQGLRARLHEPGPLYFAQTMFPEPGITSLLGSCGFDYVMIDVEHGPFTLSSLRSCLEALASTPAYGVVRCASHSEVEIKQVLDLGADGLMVPRIETADEAAAIVRAARYGPEGIRGVSRAVRAARFGLEAMSYFENANESIAVIAIIESRRGVDNVEEIAAVPGLDGFMVGGDDLAADLGVFGRPGDTGLRDAIDRVVDAAIAAGLKVGARAPRTAAERDSMLIACLNDAIALLDTARQSLEFQRNASP